MKKSLVLAFCITLLVISYTNEKAYAAVEEGVAGISKVMNETEVKPTINITYSYTTTRLNLRKEANTDSDIILTLDKRETIEVISVSSKWSKVKFKDKTGWVTSKYLSDEESPNLDFTDKEIKMLYRIVAAEVTGGNIECKSNVASVIINRVLSTEFPDTMEEVIFQEDQFAPITDRRFYEVEITEDTITAVDKVLKDGVTNEALFFCNMKDVKSLSNKKWFGNLEYLFKDSSNHSFYK